jgi:hypothetical protein
MPALPLIKPGFQWSGLGAPFALLDIQKVLPIEFLQRYPKYLPIIFLN